MTRKKSSSSQTPTSMLSAYSAARRLWDFATGKRRYVRLHGDSEDTLFMHARDLRSTHKLYEDWTKEHVFKAYVYEDLDWTKASVDKAALEEWIKIYKKVESDEAKKYNVIELQSILGNHDIHRNGFITTFNYDTLLSRAAAFISHIVLSETFVQRKRAKALKCCAMLIIGYTTYVASLSVFAHLSSGRLLFATVALLIGLIPVCDLLITSYRVSQAYYGFNAMEASELINFLIENYDNSSSDGGRRFSELVRKTPARTQGREQEVEQGGVIGEPARG